LRASGEDRVRASTSASGEDIMQACSCGEDQASGEYQRTQVERTSERKWRAPANGKQTILCLTGDVDVSIVVRNLPRHQSFHHVQDALDASGVVRLLVTALHSAVAPAGVRVPTWLVIACSVARHMHDACRQVHAAGSGLATRVRERRTTQLAKREAKQKRRDHNRAHPAGQHWTLSNSLMRH